MKTNLKRTKSFSISDYVEKALKLAEYEKDEHGIVVACVPIASGFFSQGENFEEARDNLRDAIEGNLVVALQLGFEIPEIAGVEIRVVSKIFERVFLDSNTYAKLSDSSSFSL